MTGSTLQADIKDRRKIMIACVQETHWKGSKVKDNVEGFKLYYHGICRASDGIWIPENELRWCTNLPTPEIGDRNISQIIYAFHHQFGRSNTHWRNWYHIKMADIFWWITQHWESKKTNTKWFANWRTNIIIQWKWSFQATRKDGTR